MVAWNCFGPPAERGHATKRDDEGKTRQWIPVVLKTWENCCASHLLIFKPSPRPPTPNEEALARYWCQRCDAEDKLQLVVVPPHSAQKVKHGPAWATNKLGAERADDQGALPLS